MIPVTKNIPFAGNVEAWAVARLNLAYAHCIDDDTLEQWPDFFTPDGLYRITTAENQARGLPIGIIHADGQAMMRDRVLSLREANIYEPQRYRHILSEPLVTLEAEGALRARTSFMVARITWRRNRPLRHGGLRGPGGGGRERLALCRARGGAGQRPDRHAARPADLNDFASTNRNPTGAGRSNRLHRNRPRYLRERTRPRA